jgi:hypothetical protein
MIEYLVNGLEIIKFDHYRRDMHVNKIASSLC